MREAESNAVYWIKGKPLTRRHLLSVSLGLSAYPAIRLVKPLERMVNWCSEPPKPLCLSDDGKELSFKTIPCQIPTPIAYEEPYSDPNLASIELQMSEQEP